jgi:hypothetical protein
MRHTNNGIKKAKLYIFINFGKSMGGRNIDFPAFAKPVDVSVRSDAQRCNNNRLK